MRTWPPSLKESSNPTLKAYGNLLDVQIAAADDALKLVTLADQELTDFRTFGDRQQLFNEANGLRKELHGDVSKLIHVHPSWNLGRAYVHVLFEHESTKTELSDADLERKIESLSAEVSKFVSLREQRAKDAKDEAQERAEAEKQAKIAALEAAEKEAADAAARIAALKAQIGPVA